MSWCVVTTRLFGRNSANQGPVLLRTRHPFAMEEVSLLDQENRLLQWQSLAEYNSSQRLHQRM